LLECRGACEWLDYKETLHLEHDAALCAFARDILAFKNVGGGYIVVGVRDKTWQQVGLSHPMPYDPKLLSDQMIRATGVSLDVDIVTHSIEYDAGNRSFALIHVHSSKKRSKRRSPTLVSKDFCSTKPYGLRRGDSTARVSSQEELEELLDRLEDQADEDAARAETSPSPFAIEDGT
jgi:predicted HTH transcriptional regulator